MTSSWAGQYLSTDSFRIPVRSCSDIEKLTDVNLSRVEYYHFVRGKLAGVDMIISRTGYTGELGFELYFPWDERLAVEVWNNIFQAGREFGIAPVGLGARDTLRLEMGFCLYGNDIDQTTHPLEAGLGWITKLSKGDFIGKSVMMKAKKEGLKRKLVGLILDGEPLSQTAEFWTVASDSGTVGTVSSAVYSPDIKQNLWCYECQPYLQIRAAQFLNAHVELIAECVRVFFNRHRYVLMERDC